MNLAKLMAYKDEYEVARLYADPAYLDKLREQFEGEPGRDYKLMFHLAPPLFAKRDEHGHLVKQTLRRVDAARVPRAGEDERLARHIARCIRQDGRAPHGASR